MKHAEKLIARILFLEGTPVVSKLGAMCIGDAVPTQLKGDQALEKGAIKAYNAAIALAAEVGDHATRDFLQGILNDEDRHMDQIEERQDQIEQMGLQIFLTTKVGS